MGGLGAFVRGVVQERKVLAVSRAFAAEYFLRSNTAEWYDWRIRNSERSLKYETGRFVHVILGGYVPDMVLAYSLGATVNHEFMLAPVLIGEGIRIASLARHHFYRRGASRKLDLEERV